MSLQLRLMFMVFMALALAFGYLHLFLPGFTLYDFERLHIFLFNLVSGGTIIILYTQGTLRLTRLATAFLLVSLLFALLTFFQRYDAAVIAALVLAVLVESLRWKHFAVFPVDFFKKTVPVSVKFHQAALLCLSIGLCIAALVMANNTRLHLFSLETLSLNSFFLGFSFPVSLITFSLIFNLMHTDTRGDNPVLDTLGFWTVNLGVIIFFVFIIAGMLVMQLFITSILFLSVVMIFFLFVSLTRSVQQKNFLTSGMLFLLYTAVTGIVYIGLEFSPAYTQQDLKLLLRMHSFASLYGWNLSGLAIICREHDFPIQLHSRVIITIHWITAILLAPLGTYSIPFAIAAWCCYCFILYMMLFSKGTRNTPLA